jgi:hypothetical protein
VVRAAARRAGMAVPDAAATDRVLALTAAADGDGTGWPGGSASREGTVVRLGPRRASRWIDAAVRLTPPSGG